MIRQLPEFVNRLVLLLNAGLVLSTAFERSVKKVWSYLIQKTTIFIETQEIYVNVKPLTGLCIGNCANLPERAGSRN